ncbi:MAG: STAS domain-containing protein [Gammaproteobacteria bacterium]|nr:STAS domain-containing protein [Gammaproteobacteria bacterium]
MSQPRPVAGGPGALRVEATTEGAVAVEGPLTFATARSARELARRIFAAGGSAPLEIDCARVSVSDSAGLAVLLDWLRTAKRAGRTLRYSRLPEGLVALARISEVEELLRRGV